MSTYDRHLKSKLSPVLALGWGLVALAGTPAVAANVPASSSTSSDVAIEVVPPAEPTAPLSPPPGMSVTPSAPIRRPLPEDLVQGCPVKDLKPLDLLV